VEAAFMEIVNQLAIKPHVPSPIITGSHGTSRALAIVLRKVLAIYIPVLKYLADDLEDWAQ